jgi:hypothetical protein
MADEKKQEEIKPVKTQNYKVKKEFTLDRLYKVGSLIALPNGKIKDTLTSNNFI